MTGLLDQKSSEFQSCIAICVVVYLGHGIVHRVPLIFSSKIIFLVRYRAPQVRSLRNDGVHLYRSMLLKFDTLWQPRYNSSRASSFSFCDGHGRYICVCVCAMLPVVVGNTPSRKEHIISREVQLIGCCEGSRAT